MLAEATYTLGLSWSWALHAAKLGWNQRVPCLKFTVGIALVNALLRLYWVYGRVGNLLLMAQPSTAVVWGWHARR